mgnify:CR=1 FL=1
MSSRTIVDLSKLERRFSKSALVGKQAAFAKRVAFEMRDYVPLDEGTLRDSEPLASDYETGLIVWQTPYAEHVHDLPQSSINTAENPNARSHWPEEAKRERMDSWQEFARKMLEE